MTVGEKIKYFRNQYNVAQRQLAESTGICISLIKKYETNRTIPNLHHLKQIAKFFGIVPEMLDDEKCDITSKKAIQKWCNRQINKYEYLKNAFSI